MSLRILAIDLATRKTGLAWTHRHDGTPGLGVKTIDVEDFPHDHRVDETWRWIRAACRMDPHLVVIERAYVGLAKGAVPLLLGEIHGAVKLVLRQYRIPYHVVDNKQIKQYATGNGSATKQAVREAVTADYGSRVHVSNEHESDALALLALTLHVYGEPLTHVLNPKRLAPTRDASWPRLAAVARA